MTSLLDLIGDVESIFVPDGGYDSVAVQKSALFVPGARHADF